MLYDYDGRPLSFNENVVDFLKNYMKAMVFCNLQAFLKGLIIY